MELDMLTPLDVIKECSFSGDVKYGSKTFNKSSISGVELKYSYIVSNKNNKYCLSFDEFERNFGFNNEINRRSVEAKARRNRGVYQLISIKDKSHSFNNISSLSKGIMDGTLTPKQLILLHDLARTLKVQVLKDTWTTNLKLTKNLVKCLELHESIGDKLFEYLSKSQVKIVKSYLKSNGKV
jgi:hypothetical protein